MTREQLLTAQRLVDATCRKYRMVDCRHQQAGQIRIFADTREQFHQIANVLASGKTVDADAAFIAAAPQLVVQLLGHVRALETRAREARVDVEAGAKLVAGGPPSAEQAFARALERLKCQP